MKKTSQRMVRGVRTWLAAALTIAAGSVMAGGLCTGPAEPALSTAGGSLGSASMQQSRLFSMDRHYRAGKTAIAKRDAQGERIRYCVMVDGEAKRVTKGRLRTLQGGSVDEFAHSLVDCENPGQLALLRVQDRDKIPHILYYLASHYELNLVQLSPEERLAQRAERQMRNAVASAN